MWPYDDFVEYWAAARLNLLGMNPYDPAGMLAIQQAAGYEAAEPIMMYNPPWVLVLAYPFAGFEWPVARALAYLIQGLVAVACAERLGRAVAGNTGRAGEFAVFTALTFVPVWIALRMGQFSLFQLVGVTALAGLSASAGAGRGALLAFLLVKPPLNAVAGLVLVFWLWRQRAWRVAVGLLVALTGAQVVSSLPNPEVVSQYVAALVHQPPEQFISPTIGSVLRGALAPGNIWLQFLPAPVGLAWAAWYWRRHRAHWVWSRHLPLPLFVGCLTAGYGAWVLDLVVLLPAVVLAAWTVTREPDRRTLRWVAPGYALVQVLILLTHHPATPQWTFIWVTPALLGLYLAACSAGGRNPRS